MNSDLSAVLRTQAANGPAYQVTTTWILAITFGVVFFDRNATNFLMPLMQAELRMNYTQIGMIASGLALTWAVAGLLGGAISDSAGSRKVPLVTAVVAFSLCSIVSGLAVSFATLLLARLLMGLAEGPILPISQSLIAEGSSAENRGHNMGVMQNFGSAIFGSFLAPIVLVRIGEALGWRAAFFIAGVPGLIMAYLIWRHIAEPRVVRSQGSARGEREQLKVIELLRPRNMRLCILISILMVAWMTSGWVFLPQYYTTVHGMDPSTMSWQMGVLGISAAAFSFVVPRLSDRFGRRPIVVLFCLIGAVVPLAALHVQSAPLVLAALVFFGWSASGTFPLFMAAIPSEAVAPRLLATALGLVMGLGEIFGGVIGPTAAGMAADRCGLAAPLYIQFGCALLAMCLGLFLRETAPRVVNAHA